MLWSGSPAPCGDYFGEVGTRQTPYGFTSEYTAPSTGLVHLRARDYSPALGIFPARDPFEGAASRAMSLNGYAWVEGNVVNAVDPSGEQSGCPTNATYLEPGSCGTMGTGPVTSRPLTFQNARPPSYSFNGGTSRPLDQAVVPSQPQTPRIGGTSPNTPFVRPLQPNPAIPRSQPFADPMGLANLCNASVCDLNALLDAAGVQGQRNANERNNEQQHEPACRHGIRKTVHIPDTLLPGQIVDLASAAYTALVTAPFHAGQPTVNKHDVECIASGIQQGRTVSYHFTFAQWDGRSRMNTSLLYGYDHTTLIGHWMLVDGHHRFLAWLFTGIVPQGVIPIGNFNAIPPHPAIPWNLVRWGA